MRWRNSSQSIPEVPVAPVAAVPLLIQLDAQGNVISLSSATHQPTPAPTLWGLLTPESARGLSVPLANWQGQLLDLDVNTGAGVKAARLWLSPCPLGWQLAGVWLDDLLEESAHELRRRQLLSVAAKGSMSIRQAPTSSLASTTSQVLASLAEVLGISEMALAVKADNRWRLYALAPTSRAWWLDMAVDSSLTALAEQGASQLLTPCQFAGVAALASAYPNHQRAHTWLLFGPSAAVCVNKLRAEDWQLLLAQLALALHDRLNQAQEHTQNRRTTLLQQLLQAGWWEFDSQQQRVELGPYLAEQLEVACDLSSAQWLQLLHPADAEEFSARLNTGSDAHSVSLQVRLKQHQQLRWFQLQAQRHGSQGQWHGYLLDVDALKQSQAQTELGQARLTRLVAKAPAVIYLQTAEQGALQLSFASQSLEPLLGWSLDDLAQGQLAQKIHPDDLDIYFARSRALFAQGQHRCKYRLLDSAGHYHWLLDEANVLRDAQGAVQEVVGIWLDITEATLANERIRESEERYRALVEDSPAMICRYSPELVLRFVNQPMAALLHTSTQALLGTAFSQWLSAEQLRSFAARIAQLTPEQPVISSEICVQLTTCEHAWWVWVERGIFNERGELVEIQAVGRDNTEVRKTQQQLNQSAKMATLGEMATGMAHEMNQPLHVMGMAIANVLRRVSSGTLEPEYLAEKLERIDTQIKRAAKIVDHMRVFGRRSALETQVFDPQKCVYEAAALLDESFKKQQIGVMISCGTQKLKVDGHPDQLEQVLINLLVNAKDALVERKALMPALVPKILIDTTHDQSRVWIRVQDNAGGIEAKVMERIFDPFFTTKEVGKGTGLGLSVSFSIIEQMHGRLTVKNQAEGACFCIELPLLAKQ